MSVGAASPAELAVADHKRESQRKPSGKRRIIAKPDQTLTPEAR